MTLSVKSEPDPDGDPLTIAGVYFRASSAMRQHIELVLPGAPGRVRVQRTINDGAESWRLYHVIEVRE